MNGSISSASSRLVTIDYTDLSSSQDISTQLQLAFGSSSSSAHSPLGIIAIRNVPGFLEAKRAFLPQAHKLAHLDPSYLDEELTDETSMYNAGWSRGKEKLGDVPDFSKASFYFNPLTDQPGTPEERKEYPASYPCNKWPNEVEVRQLERFQSNAKRLGGIMHKVVVLLSKQIDKLAKQKVEGYQEDLLYNAMKDTEKAKGRLLYYYPLEETDRTTFDNWIGWHNDSGFLTSLAGDLYIDDETGQPLDRSQIDPEAGLYVVDRSGESIRVAIPDDCMAVQIGECVQILTGGAVCATPHCVRSVRSDYEGSAGVKVARVSCPCFIDSKPTFCLAAPRGSAREEIVGAGIGRDKVPALEERWLNDGMTFGDFLQKSFEKYYDWKG